MADMYGWMEQVLRACGAEILPHRPYIEPMGDATHECGSARMGNDPKKSVLNKFNQVHACKNVFVTDGAFMPSFGCQNPSLSYMAFTARAVDHEVSESKKGNL